ncbi:THO complex subunit 3 [Folsomia candida]|uniref:THO complex subunit 3 n=1 Tax=Folsomia candida TaxID=158441 RepID=A0A226F1A5_FOLCA|nr:THO complex subunit 3 [Folsomia candida]
MFPFIGEATGMIEESETDEFKDHFKKNNRIREYTVHSSKIHTVAWNCEGRKLASGSFDKTVAMFTLDKDKLKTDHVFKGHTDSVDQLCWHPQHPDLLGSASGDKSVRIWDARSQKCIETFSTKGENINITWSPDGNNVAVGNKEDLLTFIDLKAGKIFHEQQFKFEVNEIAWSPEGSLFFITNGQGCICIQEFPSMKEEHVIQAHPANCICIKFHPNGHQFAVGAADAVVSLWDLKELACIRTFTNLDWPVRAISFSWDGKLIASGSEDLNIDISHVETGEKIFEVPVETPTFTVAWNPKRDVLAYACDDKDKYERDRDTGSLKLFGLPVE